MREFRAFRVFSDNNETIGRVESLNIEDLSQAEVLIKTAYSSENKNRNILHTIARYTFESASCLH